MRQLPLFSVGFLALVVSAAAREFPRAHWERVQVNGGSELLTFFSVLPEEAAPDETSRKIPVLSVLRDTLGDEDPENDSLRYVWLLVDEKQGTLSRWLTPEPDFGHMPRPVVDLSRPGKRVWRAVLRSIVQTMLLDPSCIGIRVPSRSYLSRQTASRTVGLFEVLREMVRLQEEAERGPLEPDQYSQVLARVLLADRTFGGLVRDESLTRVLERELALRRQALGKNWELMRQRAEAEGLYFQPIAVEGEPPVAAMIWISRADLDQHRSRPFQSRFLGIADPWKDRALREWNGYTEIWYFDAEGRRTADAGGSVRSQEMIPLSLYSLDHPKAPFLLIDFRSPWKPALHEAARRTIEELPLTILGVATLAHFEVRGAQLAWSVIRGRQGAAIHRPARLRAAASVRQVIFESTQLQPEIRAQVAQRLGAAARSSSRRRYEALLAAARSPKGLQERIEQDRGSEITELLHPNRRRWLKLVTVATGGLYHYRVQPSPDRLTLLDRERRVENGLRALEAALVASPHVDVGTDLDNIRRVARDLATVPSVRSSMRQKTERLLVRLAEKTDDAQIRHEFLALLIGSGEARPQGTARAGGGTD